MSDFQILNSETSRNSWIGALSVGQEFNWPICKEKSLWGTGSNNAVGVKKGDEFFLWQSGAGWSARCVVTTDARRPNLQDPAPWDDGREYKWIFGISVIKELESPFSPGSTNNRQNISNLPNIKLGQFPKLSVEEAAAIRKFFGDANPPTEILDPVREAEEDQVEQEILQRTLEGPVEKLQLVKSRRGQGVFRTNVIQIEKFCRVTGMRAIDHLRASHIKPWAKSDDLEKVDGNNGLLLSPHVDHLFDRGWIRFEADGTMITSPKLDPSVLPSWRIEPVLEKFPFNAIQIEYLAYHTESVFQK